MHAHIPAPPKKQADLVSALGMTSEQARRLVDALSSMGGFSFRRNQMGERLLSERQFDLICELYQLARPEQITREFVTAVIRGLSSLPPEAPDDLHQLALNIAVDLGDTRSRVLAIWQLLEQVGDSRLKLPDWQSTFHLESPSNAR